MDKRIPIIISAILTIITTTIVIILVFENKKEEPAETTPEKETTNYKELIYEAFDNTNKIESNKVETSFWMDLQYSYIKMTMISYMKQETYKEKSRFTAQKGYEGADEYSYYEGYMQKKDDKTYTYTKYADNIPWVEDIEDYTNNKDTFKDIKKVKRVSGADIDYTKYKLFSAYVPKESAKEFFKDVLGESLFDTVTDIEINDDIYMEFHLNKETNTLAQINIWGEENFVLYEKVEGYTAKLNNIIISYVFDYETKVEPFEIPSNIEKNKISREEYNEMTENEGTLPIMN